MTGPRLRLGVQKSGRLSERSIELLRRCGIGFGWRKGHLVVSSSDFPIDLTLVRDDDIPEYVRDGVCQLGVVGRNVLEEKIYARGRRDSVEILRNLGFGQCRLSLAIPREQAFEDLHDFAGRTIATSYPNTLQRFMREQEVDVEVVEITGSVEIAPMLGVADAVCDLVSTGATLRTHGLREVATVLESEAVLIRGGTAWDEGSEELARRLINRLDGVLRALRAKYIMMNAPRSAVAAIEEILPGLEAPTVIPLGSDGARVAIHSVAPEDVFWETMGRLKDAGASSILVVPIEKIIE